MTFEISQRSFFYDFWIFFGGIFRRRIFFWSFWGTETVLKANFRRILLENSKIEEFLKLILLGTLLKNKKISND